MPRRKNNSNNPFVAKAQAAEAQLPAEPLTFELPQPTREGAIEYRPDFRDAARRAVENSVNFMGRESGFAIRPDGSVARTPKGELVIQSSKEPGRHNLRVVSLPDDMAIFHTHPRDYDPRPSIQDVNEAKRTGKVLMDASSEGLWEVGPDGKPFQAFGPDWLKEKK